MKYKHTKRIPSGSACKAFFAKIGCFFKHLPKKFKLPKRKKLKKYLLPGLMIVFALTFLISAAVLGKTAWDYRKQAKQNNYLASLVQQQIDQAPVQRPPISTDGSTGTYEEPPSAFVEIAHPETGEMIKILREYAPVYQLNTDMVGWISLPGTTLNYPVVQTPEDPHFYLKRDFYQKSSRNGTIYAHGYADLQAPSDNVTIYGHNMKDGSMFASLHQYESEEFFKANPYIYFDTLYEHRTYQVISVFEIDITKNNFEYHNFVNGNTISFKDYVDTCRELSLYDTGVRATYGDKLLTLSTCDMDTSTDDVRFVVVAKLVT